MEKAHGDMMLVGEMKMHSAGHRMRETVSEATVEAALNCLKRRHHLPGET